LFGKKYANIIIIEREMHDACMIYWCCRCIVCKYGICVSVNT